MCVYKREKDTILYGSCVCLCVREKERFKEKDIHVREIQREREKEINVKELHWCYPTQWIMFLSYARLLIGKVLKIPKIIQTIAVSVNVETHNWS